MAKASKDKDRRAVVEQMRREQQRSEKRRTRLIVGACVVIGLVIVGAAAIPVIQDAREQDRLAGEDLDTLGASASQAGCTDVEARDATGSADHRPDNEPLTYPDAPPSTGPHYAAPADFTRKFYSPQDRPEIGNLVHNLEHGYNILWYDETVAGDDAQLAVVEGIANKFEGNEFEDKFIAAPWTSEDGEPFPGDAHIALTHWSMGGTNGNPEGQQGIVQYCGEPSGEAVGQFIEDYPYTDSPEPNAA